MKTKIHEMKMSYNLKSMRTALLGISLEVTWNAQWKKTTVFDGVRNLRLKTHLFLLLMLDKIVSNSHRLESLTM